MSKTVLSILAIVLLAGGYLYVSKSQVADTEQSNTAETTNLDVQNAPVTDTTVKEFTMDSWMEKKDDKMSAHFSLNEIRVKMGDRVKITITNTAGTHDFVLDEFNISQDTPLNQPVTVEFVADKVGTFEYYCSKYNHRALGQRGNLIVE